ncbi:MAG: hypothetical protein ACRDTG_23060 [Pseudonocardiaceae bacterium]
MTLAAVDGAADYPPGAPYDRIISTCAVSAILDVWLAQSAPGAVILTDVRGSLGGTLARLTCRRARLRSRPFRATRWPLPLCGNAGQCVAM